MKATYINYSDTNNFAATVLSYLDQDSKLSSFISQKPTSEGFGKLLANKRVTANRDILLSVLKEQYLNFDSPLVAANIELLKNQNTFTVTTGHQLNLFTGPLYFIYKIVTAINLSVELKGTFPDKDFVPIYWMATEDHDFEEINHTYIGGKKISWDKISKGATGKLSTDGIDLIVKEYTSILGLSQNADRLVQIIKTAYINHSNLADASRYLVDALFKSYGLVVIDADHPKLKNQFKEIIAQDILEQNSYKRITSTAEKLSALNIHSPINPREINFFYLLKSLRERLVFENNRYVVLNSEISFSEDELKKEIEDYPERFSPNVVMRPLYQEVILPNIAYVGGGAEVAYWLELKENFDHYQIDFPILILRNSALIVGNKQNLHMQKLGFSYFDLFKSTEELKKKWLLKHSQHTLNLTKENQELEKIFEKIKLRASKIDITLSASAEAIKARLNSAITNMEKKMLKADKRNHTDSLAKIDKLKQQLYPQDGLQERTENFGHYYVMYGDEFIASLIHAFKPLEFKFTILQAE
ncbi:MAG: bacillithiol biosynthesis cysteine-adding enzyme BshC [Flavobacterium sp.]|nr:bacillithiol biosynthesis cysteine-adding enzyme BshC [Pedobacter sp.]